LSEALKEAQLEELVGNKKADKEPKLLVKDGDQVTAGQPLFAIGEKKVKSDRAGEVKIEDKLVKVMVEEDKAKEFIVPKGVSIIVNDGDEVKKGDQLTDGSLDLQQLFKLKGRLETQKYIINEIKSVYSSQGQPLNDKHVEIIARQMFSRFFVHESGESELLPGEIVEASVIRRAQDKAGKKADSIKAERLLLGITKASLTTDSFLSAASFQETARVLIEAAVSGKIDYLEGLKENVIIGRLIPAGTGFNPYEKRPDFSAEE
jgi:DNA-directed RNA polymerase subunit beta'